MQVSQAESVVKENQGPDRYEYLPISSFAPFVSAARQVLFGSLGTNEYRVVSLQTISGTGAKFLVARFLAETLEPSAMWLSDPSWVNYVNILGLVGVNVKRYPYWNAATKQLDIQGMILKLETEANPSDMVLLHACARNPPGVNPNKDQWKVLADTYQGRGLFLFFGCA